MRCWGCHGPFGAKEVCAQDFMEKGEGRGVFFTLQMQVENHTWPQSKKLKLYIICAALAGNLGQCQTLEENQLQLDRQGDVVYKLFVQVPDQSVMSTLLMVKGFIRWTVSKMCILVIGLGIY